MFWKGELLEKTGDVKNYGYFKRRKNKREGY